jgi:4-alpha-glucanotransferase
LGETAYTWVDFLAEAGQGIWQVLPLGPTGYGDSPYQCFSAFAGNPYLISLERLVAEGLLDESSLTEAPDFPREWVDYGAVIPFKLEMLSRSFKVFEDGASREQAKAFAAFCHKEAHWLEDYALFMACKEIHEGRPWNTWNEELRRRDPKVLGAARRDLAAPVRRQQYWQWLFYEQWRALKRYANERQIKIIGDIPIFVALDSADVWAHADLFHLDDEGNPTLVAGVPPDYFSVTGQRWGNPLYRWPKMAENGYRWWLQRFASTLDFVDLMRVDHFRGFEACWEIPAREATAVKGRWVKGPEQDLFDAAERTLGRLPIIAEDLGLITPEVEKLRDDNDLPGMKVLQFAFGDGASNPYLPHNYTRNFIVYSGTHDNDTTVGWYGQLSETERDSVRRYLARDGSDIAWDFIRLACASVADIAIAPLQDVLRLGSEARMNTPGQAVGNWTWRFTPEQLGPHLAPALCDMAELYGRLLEADTDAPHR